MPKAWVVRALSTINRNELVRRQLLSESLENLPKLKDTLNYSCDVSKLRSDLRPKWTQLSANLTTLEFLRSHPPHSSASCWVRSITGMFMSHTNANTFLGMYKMHVIDKENLRQFLQAPLGKALGTLLDVGAGDGTVTSEIMPLFDEVLATEVSYWCLHRLKTHGIPCLRLADISSLPEASFDFVSCFNVLDRCSHPISLLRGIRRCLRPITGRAVIAVVFPFHPFVEAGAVVRYKAPVENVDLDHQLSWEESVNNMAKKVFEPAGLEIERISRVPYLSQGDVDVPYYVLDDALFLLKAC